MRKGSKDLDTGKRRPASRKKKLAIRKEPLKDLSAEGTGVQGGASSVMKSRTATMSKVSGTLTSGF